MLARERLDDPARTRDELEVELLTKLMRRDAKIWARHTQYDLGGTVDEPDTDEALAEKQVGVQGGNGQQPKRPDLRPSGSRGALRGLQEWVARQELEEAE